jgi:lipopolysaccharide/colanic/teichoic acid biosynthesis glycosyltransferase
VTQDRKAGAPLREASGGRELDGSTHEWRPQGESVSPSRAAAPGHMRARKQKFLILFVVQLAVSVALWLAARYALTGVYSSENLLSYRLLFPLALFFLSYFLLNWHNVYSRDYHYYLRRAHGTVLKNGLFPAALTFLAFIVLGTWRIHPVTLSVGILAVGFVSFAFADGCQYLWIRYLGSLGYFRKKILIIGRAGLPLSTDSRMRDFGSTKICAGEIDRTNGVWLWKPAGGGTAKVVKDFPAIRTIILKENIGDIMFFPGAAADGDLERELVAYCQSQSIGYSLVPGRTGSQQTGIASLIFPHIPASERYAGPRDSLTAVSAKRLLDMVISFFCLVLFLPAGLVIALAILFQDGLPIFYMSTRIGKNGRPMRFFKFRTMTRNADVEKQQLLPFNARSDGPLFKMRNDPRVTRIGGVLRRYSLDEFPQLLNVLLGTMSLVGPRPHLPQEVAQYGEGDYLRLECMPGIVGLPQVAERNTTMGFREWVDLDLFYRRRWSLALDMSVIAKTVAIFFRAFISRGGPEHY